MCLAMVAVIAGIGIWSLCRAAARGDRTADEVLTPEPDVVELAEQMVYDYAVRYCLQRRSYAFDDGLVLADRHWPTLTPGTRRDVIDAITVRPDPVELDRYPRIAAQFALDHGITS